MANTCLAPLASEASRFILPEVETFMSHANLRASSPKQGEALGRQISRIRVVDGGPGKGNKNAVGPCWTLVGPVHVIEPVGPEVEGRPHVAVWSPLKTRELQESMNSSINEIGERK